MNRSINCNFWIVPLLHSVSGILPCRVMRKWRKYKNLFEGGSLSHNNTHVLPQHWKAISLYIQQTSGIRTPVRNSTIMG